MFDQLQDRTSPVLTGWARTAVGVGLAALIVGALVSCSGGSSGADGDTTRLPEAALVDLSTGEEAGWGNDETPLIVNFWASWCTPCRTEMPAFQEVQDQLGDRITVVGVTDETNLDEARKVAAETGVDYPLLVDTEQELLVDLDITGMPGTVFVDENGNVVATHLGALTKDELLTQIEEHHGITP